VFGEKRFAPPAVALRRTFPIQRGRDRLASRLTAPARAVGAIPSQIDDGYVEDRPLGGLGNGSIGRTYRGDFARWHLDPGFHTFQPRFANQFSAWVARRAKTQATVLCAGSPRAHNPYAEPIAVGLMSTWET